ncbi:hypothetical protein C8R47DRAFT_1075182 [Mycena vitilis]|nr:hypothetical protein C8R47DRAFT_1075182 [Mycena vitilis]
MPGIIAETALTWTSRPNNHHLYQCQRERSNLVYSGIRERQTQGKPTLAEARGLRSRYRTHPSTYGNPPSLPPNMEVPAVTGPSKVPVATAVCSRIKDMLRGGPFELKATHSLPQQRPISTNTLTISADERRNVTGLRKLIKEVLYLYKPTEDKKHEAQGLAAVKNEREERQKLAKLERTSPASTTDSKGRLNTLTNILTLFGTSSDWGTEGNPERQMRLYISVAYGVLGLQALNNL